MQKQESLLQSTKYKLPIKSRATDFTNGLKVHTQLQYNQILPLNFQFKTSQQNQQIQFSVQDVQDASSGNLLFTSNQSISYPYSCIGLIIGHYKQNGQEFKVYTTGVLINKKIVLASAQSVYCRRLEKQYQNIKFIPGLHGDSHNGIYDVKRVYYSSEQKSNYSHTKWYNIAILQLYRDLSQKYGYLSLISQQQSDGIQMYNYRKTQTGYFYLFKDLINNLRLIDPALMIKNEMDNSWVVGICNPTKQKNQIVYFTNQIRSKINQWTIKIQLNLQWKSLGSAVCLSVIEYNLNNLNLNGNNIGNEGCKTLSDAYLCNLTHLYLKSNKIDQIGCYYLKSAKWSYLSVLYLGHNSINEQSCKYLIQANLRHLQILQLSKNKIDPNACRYLSYSRWPLLKHLFLQQNKIKSEGCKYLINADWTQLRVIKLTDCEIESQGYKYLKDSNWKYLTNIHLLWNNIRSVGYEYLKDANWPNLNTIILCELPQAITEDRIKLKQKWHFVIFDFDW